jgi:hypothetical protein
MIYDTSNELEVNKLLSRLDALLSKKCIIELTEKKKTRTLSQNAYLHVCITLFAIAYGTTIFGAKVFLKEQCGFMVVLKKGKKDYRSTAELNTLEMTKFIEWIRNYSSIELGNYIPTPDEYIQNKFAIDSEIEKFKEYL